MVAEQLSLWPKELAVCPACAGRCTAGKTFPGVGGCDKCKGDGVVWVAGGPRSKAAGVAHG